MEQPLSCLDASGDVCVSNAGAGLSWYHATDLQFAPRTGARFGAFKGARLGDFGAGPGLPRISGSDGRRKITCCQTVSSAEALRIGLVSNGRPAEELLGPAITRGRALAQLRAGGLRLM